MLRNQKNQEVSRLMKQVREIESKVEEVAFFFQVTSTRTGKSFTLLFNNLIDAVRGLQTICSKKYSSKKKCHKKRIIK